VEVRHGEHRRLLADGVVYVGDYAETIYALGAETGEERWTLDVENYVYSEPAVVDGTVYVGNGAGTVFALASEAEP